MVDEFDPDFVFCQPRGRRPDRPLRPDRHDAQGRRRAALVSTDTQVGRFVSMLKSTGKWDTSMVLVLADHSMDWSMPDPDDQPEGGLRQRRRARRELRDRPERRRRARLLDRRRVGEGRRPDLACRARRSPRRGSSPPTSSTKTPDLHLGPKAGDLLVYCQAGWRFSDPGPQSNPIPGNHGHPATEPIPFFVSGGSSSVHQGVARSARAHTMDVAPTLAAYFGTAGSVRRVGRRFPPLSRCSDRRAGLAW